MATDAYDQWPWYEGPAYAWGSGEFSGGELEVEGHESLATIGQLWLSMPVAASVFFADCLKRNCRGGNGN